MIPCTNKIIKLLLQNIAKQTQSEITAELSDPEMSVPFSICELLFQKQKEVRDTAVVANARYKATENQAQQRFEHSARSCPSNAVIKVLLIVDQMAT